MQGECVRCTKSELSERDRAVATRRWRPSRIGEERSFVTTFDASHLEQMRCSYNDRVEPKESRLEQARRHVREGEGRVAAQERLIAELAADGHDTFAAWELLRSLQETLTAMRQHLANEERQAQA
jgi:hypothetical protein